MDKTSTGLQENVAGLLAYVLGWVSGLVFILIEKENKFVRFHAMQSIIVFGAITVINILLYILWVIPVVGWIFGTIIATIMWVLAIVLWIILMVKAYQGERFKLPIAGDMAEKYS